MKGRIAAAKQSRSTDGFWVIHVLGCFQGPARAVQGANIIGDGDKDTESATINGYSTRATATSNADSGALVFREVVKDGATELTGTIKISDPVFWKMTSMHESGHEFGIPDHTDWGSIMRYDDIRVADTTEKVDALQFNGRALRVIIKQAHPGK